jgi:hypothetical protein
MLRRYFFQQTAILSVTLRLTFRSLSIPESQFSKTWQRKVILRGKGDSGLSYAGTDEIPVSHLTGTTNAGKSIWLYKAILKIFKPLENGFLLLSWWFPFKIQKKMGRPPVYQHRLFELIIDPSWNLLDNTGTFKGPFSRNCGRINRCGNRDSRL